MAAGAAALTVITAVGGAPGRAAAAPLAHSTAAPGTISTVAGGVGGPGKATRIALEPCGVGLHPGGLYVADDTSVRNIDAAGELTTPVGTGVGAGPAADGGPATAADTEPCSVTTDAAGNMVLTDLAHSQIDVVAATSGTFYGQAMTAGDIYSVAGDGHFGYSASGVPARSAPLGAPRGVAVDRAGNLVIADSGNGRQTSHWARLQVVAAKAGTFYGVPMTAGNLYTVAGSGTLIGGKADGHPAIDAAIGKFGGDVAVDAAGNLLYAGAKSGRIWVVAAATGTCYGQKMTAGDIYTIAGTGGFGFSGDGGLATKAKLGAPEGVTVDAAGNVLVADSVTARVRVVAAKTGTFYGQKMTASHIYTIAGDGTPGYSGDGGPATKAGISFPEGMVVDPATGNVVFADAGNGLVRAVAETAGTFYGKKMKAGDIYTVGGTPGEHGEELFSGDGGPATRAQMEPEGVAVDHAGNTVIDDSINCRIRVVAAGTGTFYGRAMTAGDIYTVAGTIFCGFSGDGGPATRAEINTPEGVSVDGAGNLLIADSGNGRIRVMAASTGTFYGQAMTAGDIYTVAGNGKFGYSGDGGPATAAALQLPDAAAVDPAGNIVIADTLSSAVRVVAATTGTFYGVPMTAGDIYTVAGDGNLGYSGDGGPASKAVLGFPEGIAVDAAGNLVFSDFENSRVRVVAAATGTFYGVPMTAGDIYTVAGDGKFGYSGDGGPATAAEVNDPDDVAVDGAGNILIADDFNSRVRVVAARTGTFYGVPMTAGDIYTVAGNGNRGFTGDGGPATSAEIDGPSGVTADGQGDLLISDSGRIRMITG